MKTFKLTYGTTLKARVRVTIKEETREAAEFAAEEILRDIRKLKLELKPGNMTITKASVVRGAPTVSIWPCLLKIGNVDIDDACRECGDDTFGSGGYDGRCGHCADRYENRRNGDCCLESSH